MLVSIMAIGGPTPIGNYMASKVWTEIIHPFPNINGAATDIWNRQVISSHILLDLWLLIHAGIKVNPC